MKVAIVDLGTNTFNLLIAEVSKSKFREVYSTKLAVKLGEGGINKHFITASAFERGIVALKEYKKITDKYKVEKVSAFATSAVREASNGDLFIKAAKTEANISVKKISGNKEADLIYLGVRQAVRMNEKKSLIIDIGGGSIEFIIANSKTTFWKKSFLLGVARVLEKFNPSDPITAPQIKKIEKHFSKGLEPLFRAIKKWPVTELIGSSGSFESLAAMIAYRFYSPTVLKGKTEYLFNLEDCEEIYNALLRSTRAERLNMKGLITMRVDMIVVSSILVNLIIQKTNLNKMRLSTYSLKEGAISAMIQEDVKKHSYSPLKET